MLGDRRLDPGPLVDGVRVEDGEEALGDEVVDPALVRPHLRQVVVGARGDDRVVVLDALVVDDPAERKLLEAGDVRGRLRVALVRPTWAAVGLISPIMSEVRKREFVRGYVIALCSS